ncbi:MAG TPA: hypothetical protein VE913_23190 [Longimicrobium sp.]|nr:hypothetical protein [Longimicrobium sp.]
MFIRACVVLCVVSLLSVDALAAQRNSRRTWVIPHVLERAGRVADTPNTVDTELHMVSFDRGATVEVRVYGDDGQPMRSRTGQPVCAPCTVTFSAGPKQLFSLDERISAAGGFAREVMTGFVVYAVSGPGEVAVQGFVVNAHTSAFDLRVVALQPQEVRGPVAQ